MIDPVGIFTTARDGTGEIVDFVVEYLNDAACRAIGRPFEAVVGKTIGALSPAWRDAALLPRYSSVVRTGHPLALDGYPYGIESGDETLGRYLDLRAAKLGDGIVATWRDVTDRVEMELELREAHAYTRELIESSIDAMLTTDVGGVIRDVNRRLEELLGTGRDGLIGSRFRDFCLDRDAAADAIHETFSRGRVEGRRLIVRGSDGRSTPISFNANTFAGLGGEVRGLFATLRDVTERLRFEEHLRRRDEILEARVAERTAELEIANRELEGFSYSVSHDLRAPLRAIQGFANILEVDHGEQLDPEARRVLGVIMDSTRRMGELIDDLLGFSRVARRQVEMRTIDMTALARSVVADVRTHHAGRDVVVEVGDLEPGRGDEGLIRQALTNLVDNAFKFTRPVDRARIEIGSEARGDRVAYVVRDNGVGYDERYADKLFQVFQRLHSATEFEGTGIGLALVHRIVDRHGGTVSAEGTVGGGAAFRFTLPRAKE